ncbi:uncharacterized protein V6R79_009833 [Siganus canaliculatus]
MEGFGHQMYRATSFMPALLVPSHKSERNSLKCNPFLSSCTSMPQGLTRCKNMYSLLFATARKADSRMGREETSGKEEEIRREKEGL